MSLTKLRYGTSWSFDTQAYLYRVFIGHRTILFIDERGIPVLQWRCLKHRETNSKGARHAQTILDHIVDGFLYWRVRL